MCVCAYVCVCVRMYVCVCVRVCIKGKKAVNDTKYHRIICQG
jgi:hypothetical protein